MPVDGHAVVLTSGDDRYILNSTGTGFTNADDATQDPGFYRFPRSLLSLDPPNISEFDGVSPGQQTI